MEHTTTLDPDPLTAFCGSASFQWAVSPGHAVQFYECDDYLRGVAVAFLADGLIIGQPCVAIATAAHCESFVTGLAERGFSVPDLIESDQLTLLDAREILELVTADGVPDPARFKATLGAIFDRLGGRRRMVRLFGEMVDLLWKGGSAPAAIRLEGMWNALDAKYRFALLCGYAVGSFAGGHQAEAFEAICGQHHHVMADPPLAMR